jgi:hypothetical protein
MSCAARFCFLLEEEMIILLQMQKERQQREMKEEKLRNLEMLKKVNHFPSLTHEYGGSLPFSQIMQNPSVQLHSDETVWERNPCVVTSELPMFDRYLQMMNRKSSFGHAPAVPLSCCYDSSLSASRKKRIGSL